MVTGHAFWYAWDPPKGTLVDPTLRLQVSLDEDSVATYSDATTDPADLPKALVNSFSFEPEVVVPDAAGETRVPVSLRVFNLSGRLVRTFLKDAELDPGIHSVTWDGVDDLSQK